MSVFTATTTAGPVRGVPSGIPSTVVYRSIPFAIAPRFAPPEPVTPWNEERLCGVFAPIPPQQQLGELLRTLPDLSFANFYRKEFYPILYPVAENPLTLTVWTPAQRSDDKLPVMVWIHGGGMSTGFDYEMEVDGEGLGKRGVILVSINYRVNVLGHFAHPELSRRNEHGVSGNWSILDQQAALRWVRDNIAQFGGDPDNVTIFGQSAGGGSVISHLCSPLSRGLFHRAIIQSGAGILSYARNLPLENAEAYGIMVCGLLGKTVDELQAMPLAELMQALAWAEQNGAGPCPKQNIDGYVFSEDMADQIRAGRGVQVPLMIGSVNGDGSPFTPDPDKEPLLAMAEYRYGKRAAAFLEQYPPMQNADVYGMLGESGAEFLNTVICEARRAAGQDAYLYYFHPYIPGGDAFHFVPDGTAYHSSELWYVFGTLNRCWRSFDGRHYDLSNLMMDYWTNFAKSGDPNGPTVPVWPAYNAVDQTSQDITEETVYPRAVAPLLQKLAGF